MVLTQGIDTYRVFTEILNGTFIKREAVGSNSAGNTPAALKPAEPVEVPVEVESKLK